MLMMELGKLFNTTPIIHSLEPYSSTYMCATVTFPEEAPNFFSLKLADLELSHRPSPGQYDLAYDTKFIGVTPLFDAGEKAEVEYVTSFAHFFSRS